jgi:hypothetical protein
MYFLRHCVPNKGLHHLRRFAAIYIIIYSNSVTFEVTLLLYITVLRILPFVMSFFLSCPNTIDAWPEPGPAQRGGAFAPYERFAVGKTSAQGEFISPEHVKSPGLHKNNHT